MPMLSVFEQEKIAAAGMFLCFLSSIGIRSFLASLYQRMIRETDNMATTQNKLLKQCKLKFMNCFQLNNGVANVPVFVDKFINKLSLGPFSFRLLYHISGQLMLLAVIFSGIAVCRRIAAGCMFGEILPFYAASLVQLYFYFALTTIMDIKGRRKALKTNLVDYLENHLCNRMQLTGADIQMLYGGSLPEPRRVDILPIAGWMANREEEKKETPKEGVRQGEEGIRPLDAEETAELEGLLKEILTLS